MGQGNMSAGGASNPIRVDRTRTVLAPVRARLTIDLINPRTLERESFVRSVELLYGNVTVTAFGSVQDWRDNRGAEPASVVFYNVGANEPSDPEVASTISRVVQGARPTPLIVLAESEDVREMIAAIDAGAVGYLPASIGLDVIMEATELTCTGGLFLPLASLSSLRDTVAPNPETAGQASDDTFTSRQAAVAEALRHGKANKIIAFELNMSESTVKVHVRNIMKKLGATNRTEAAFKLNSLHGRVEDQ